MSLFISPAVPALNDNAAPIEGAEWRFSLSGTTTPATVYADADLSTPLGSSVESVGGGRFPAIHLDPTVIYRARQYDASGALIPGADYDPYLYVDSALMSVAGRYDGQIPTETAQARFNSEPLSFFRYLPVEHRFAFEDGTTEADILSYLQDGINEAIETGRTLHLPDGKYLGFTRQNTSDGKKGLLIIPSGASLTLRGNGLNTRFTVPDDFTDDGDYNFFYDYDAQTTPLGTIDISGIHIDGNGPNNLVTGSSSIDGTIRGAYPIKLRGGHRFTAHNCYFTDNPGRNIINLSNATLGLYDWDTVKLFDNHVQNSGGAILGNENQNDHSSFYVQAEVCLEKNNTFVNDNNTFDPLSAPSRAVNAMESHCRIGIHIDNVARNYGSGGIVAAQRNDVDLSLWIGCTFSGKSNLFSPFVASGRYMRMLRIANCQFHIDNSVGTGGTAFFESTSSAVIAVEPDNITITDCDFFGQTQTPHATATTHGIQISAAKSLTLKRLNFDSIQGDGILLTNHAGGLDISNFEIDEIRGRNVGIHTANTRVWLVDLRNADSGDTAVFRNGKIGPNIRIVRDPQAVGTSPLNSRGINITGPGHIQNVEVHMPHTYNINRSQRVTFASTSKFRNVRPVSRLVTLTRSETPVSGYFDIGSATAPGERVVHVDPAAGYPSERIVTTAGSANEGTWAAGTAYLPGQWIKTSGNKTLECTVGGTSDASALNEPNPATLGQQYSDGTVTWLYRDSAIVVFANSSYTPLTGTATYNAPSIASGAETTTTVTVTGAALGDKVTGVSFGVDLAGLKVSAYVSAANTVTLVLRNDTGGAIDLASTTVSVNVIH